MALNANSPYNNWNSPYANNSGMNRGPNSYNRVPRGWLIFAQVLGTFISVLGLIVFIINMGDIYRSLPNDDLTKKSIIALILSIITYFVWRSFYTAWVIIRLAQKSSDEELCANRYIISSLSLGIGGFFTPFLMTSFPNIATDSTIKPRYFLSKTMGLCVLIGAPILLISYFLPLLVGTNAVANLSLIFNYQATIGIISTIILVLGIVAFLFGLLTTSVFFTKNQSNNDFAYQNGANKQKIISTIWMAILTFELVIVILFAFVRLLGAIADFFRAGERGSGGAIMMLFALLNLFITMSYVGMVVYITSKTIAGLWSIDGTVKIGKYQHSTIAQNRLNTNNLSA